jgi:aspartate aminotransferase
VLSTMQTPTTPSSALAGVRDGIGDIPLDNIARLAKDRLGDPDVLPLWFGEGDVAAPAFIGEALARAIADGHVFYTHQNGVPALRAALADYLTGLGGRPIPPDRITVTAGGMNAILFGLQLGCGPGDNVIVIDRVWPNAAGAARLLGAEVRPVRMDMSQGGWRLDLDKVAAAFDRRTRALFFASPGNPTGAMLPVEVQRELLERCRAAGAWLIADEVYNRLVFGRRSAPTMLDLAEPEDRVIVVGSFSKSWAMTGWRLGWMTHPPSIGATLAMMTQYTTSGVPAFLQHAGVAAIRDGEPFVASMRDYCEAGMRIVCDALETAPRARLVDRPVAGMYALFEIEGRPNSREACLEILNETGVGLAPGVYFGPGSEHLYRACVCRSPESLREAMRRLAPALS